MSPVRFHPAQTLEVLASGRSCASAVPMATTLGDIDRVLDAVSAASGRYMMMETAVYTRQFFHACQLRDEGAFGRIQFLRGAHYQDMEQWPPYWLGLPPMWYATHAVAPLLAIAGTRATAVHCFGSGWMRPELQTLYGQPYPVKTAIFQLEAPGLAAEVTRSLFHGARDYMESFTVYGENACYEMQMENEPPLLFEMSPVVHGERRRGSLSRPEPADRGELLPPEIAKYTRRFVYNNEETHLSFEQGGGHHGSHPHLVHEFVRCIVEDRPSAIDAVTAANWTAAGICAHQSAMAGGQRVEVPAF